MASPTTSHKQLLQPLDHQDGGHHGLVGVDSDASLPAARSPGSAASSTSSFSSSSSAASTLTDDGLVSVDIGEDAGGADGDDFSLCKMKTVSVSSLLMPSPCYIVLLLLCPPAFGLVLFLFVQHFVPVLVQILMDM